MAKPDGRVEKGQSLNGAISATRWNDLCDTADKINGRQGGVSATPKKKNFALARTIAPWAKGEHQNLQAIAGPSGQEVTTGTLRAYNHLADINSGKVVVIALLGETWCLIAAEC